MENMLLFAVSVPAAVDAFDYLYYGNSSDIDVCATITSCGSCVDSSGCGWCSLIDSCLSHNTSSLCNSTTIQNECGNPDYIVVIFIVILAVLVCLCFGTCYWRKFRGLEEDSMLAPLLPQQARNILWRNSLHEQGEQEWMCVICGFDNKPRAQDCILCGTSHAFTLKYKSEKIEFRRQMKEKKKKQVDKLNFKLTVDSVSIPSDNLMYENAGTDTALNPLAALMEAVSPTQSPTPTPPPTPSRSSAVFFSASPMQTSLSSVKRREALNYRRLNQLSLRQKSARRRKMWQRYFDHTTGEVKWVRSSAAETRVGSAPMGYSPGTSFCDPNTSSFSFISQSRPFRNSDSVNGDSMNSLDRSTSKLLMAAAAGLPSSVRSARGDSFGDPTLVSSSPGYTSMFDEQGDLHWEKVVPDRAVKKAFKQSAAATAGPTASDIEANEAPIFPPPLDDLEAVAAMTFKEKQLWFLNHMSRLQKTWSEGCVILDLHRCNLLEESHRAIMSITKTDDLHKWLRIQFSGEPGVDAGGLEREWFGLVTKELLSPSAGLFTCASSDGLGSSYHINPLSEQFNPLHLSYFRFAGRVFGKAIMEQQAIPATLSLPIRKQMLCLPITFSDLEFVDADIYRNLVWLQSNTGVENVSLDFTVTYEAFGKKATFDLIPDGSTVAVTDENKDEYLIARLKHRILDSIKPQLECFLKGLYEVVPPVLLSVFDYQELDLLLCGVPDIDLHDWMRHTEYLAEYHQLGARHKVIRWFWLAVEAMSTEERIRLLQFTTGCSRLPAQGFKALQSHDGHFRKFNIQSIRKRECLYPRAHTCFNKLDLPLYDSQEELDAYLSVVINMEIVGFSME